jgi:hypothetical protein
VEDLANNKLMTLKDAKIRLSQCHNNLEYWINEKLILTSKATIQAQNIKEESVNGGLRTDKYAKLDYIIDDIDPIIEYLNNEIRNLNNFIEQSLKTLGEYEPLERKIIELRENKKMKWEQIASVVNYSERQCQRIYDKYCKRTRKTRNNI